MKLKYILITCCLLIGTVSSFAQQEPTYLFYRYNMNYVNPAYAGVDSLTTFGANVRSQWSGVAGAPETQSFFGSTFLGKNVGLGVSIINDKTFIEKQTSIAVDFSYRVQWDASTRLYFGIKASGNSYNVNTAGLTTFGIGSDPSLMDLDGGITPNVGVGFLITGSRFRFSVSAPKILKPKRLEREEGSARLGRNKMHLYLMGSYDFDLGSEWVLKPSTMFRYVEDAPNSLDLTVLAAYRDILEFGGAYRVDEGIAGLLLFNLGKGFRVGYAYETSAQSDLSQVNNGTHEIFMSLQL